MKQEKIEEYKNRLSISIIGSLDLELYSKTGYLISKGYTRIVIGDRGAYIEFEKTQIKCDIFIPINKEWKLRRKYINIIDYIEFRSRVDNIKIYDQKKTVDYADYKVGKYYIDPCDLYLKDKTRVLAPKREKKK